MKTNKIESNILLFIIIRGIFLLFFFKESLLNTILGSILGIILIYFANKLNLKKSMFIKIILVIILFLSSILVLHNITDFIDYNILKDYSLLVIGLLFIGICLLISIKGYHSYIKTVELSFYVIIFFSIASFLLLIYNIDISNFNRQLVKELDFSFNFMTMGLYIFIGYFLINYLNDYKLNNKVYFGSILFIILLKLLTIGIIGETLLNIYDYPYISILKRIKYLDFIERMEGILSLQYLFDFFFIFSLILLCIKYLVGEIFKLKKDKIINITLSIVASIIFIFAFIIP